MAESTDARIPPAPAAQTMALFPELASAPSDAAPAHLRNDAEQRAAAPAGDPPRILVGTASWTDPTLIQCGRFYPRGCSSAEARLRFYASRFPMVEVNSSYYALPTPSNAQLWADRTPPAFVFNVKAFRLFTGHQTPVEVLPTPVREALVRSPRSNVYYRDLPRDMLDLMWATFVEAVEPLRAAGKLGALHFQFAPWFICAPPALEHLDEVRERLRPYLLSVEFRHESWFNERHRERTLDFETRRGLVNVVVDEPQGFTNSIGMHWVATQPELAVVRLHGRNAGTWNIQGATTASDRFNYDYSDDELGDLARSILDLSSRVATTHVVFNNNYEDQGQRNAMTLQRMLQAGCDATAACAG